MQEFGFFLGRFHVLALHLPIGIVIAAVVLDWLTRRPRYAPLASAAPLLWGLAAISAVLTAALGYLHFGEGGFTGPSADAHRLWGTITAVAAVAGWWLAARSAGRAGAVRLAAGIAMLALVSLTGHYGGNLTHGTTFLGEYAPSFLRSLIGAAPRRPPVTSVAAADPYLDVVQPLLEQRCGTCHNDDKREGGFSVGSYDSTLAGGDTGRAIVPGNLEARAAHLSHGLAARRRGLHAGRGQDAADGRAGRDPALVGRCGCTARYDHQHRRRPRELEPLLAAQLGLGGAPSAPTVAVASAADPQLVANLFAAGLLVRQVSQSDARLVVSVNSPGAALAAPAFAALQAAATEIVDLNLADTALDDAALAAIGALPAVTHLRLARNRLTDAALVSLAALPQVAHLNLYGNSGVTDAGLASLAASGSLREFYVWQTGATADGVAQLRAQRPSSSWTSARSRRPPHVERTITSTAAANAALEPDNRARMSVSRE